MTRATTVLVTLWFLAGLLGIGAIFLYLARSERIRAHLEGFVLCALALAPQAPLMFLLGWVALAKARIGDPSPLVHLPALLGVVFGPAALIAGAGRVKQSANRCVLFFGVASLGVALAVGSFTAIVFMITI